MGAAAAAVVVVASAAAVDDVVETVLLATASWHPCHALTATKEFKMSMKWLLPKPNVSQRFEIYLFVIGWSISMMICFRR